jgi:hypothetical protein
MFYLKNLQLPDFIIENSHKIVWNAKTQSDIDGVQGLVQVAMLLVAV